jgi:AMP-binding enzyme
VPIFSDIARTIQREQRKIIALPTLSPPAHKRGTDYKMDYDFSFLPDDAALLEYLPGILSRSSSTFLSHYDFLPDKSVSTTNYTREEFWVMTMRCITLLQNLGGTKGTRMIHYVSGNIVEDLVLRTATVFLGIVPVTINWQADIVSQIDYKITSTEAKIIVIDSRTPDVPELRNKYPSMKFLNVNDIKTSPPIDARALELYLKSSDLARVTDTRCIIFTSGTTGHPKGVELSYLNYRVNRATFESFLEFEDPSVLFVPVAVNPMHHTNSTSITDWALRRPQTHLHLLDRYSTQYWSIISAITMGISIDKAVTVSTAESASEILNHTFSPPSSSSTSSSSSSSPLGVKMRKVICPLVSRHIDFLESLAESETIGIPSCVLRECLSHTVLLIGSAPVGPSTTNRLLKYANRLPTGVLYCHHAIYTAILLSSLLFCANVLLLFSFFLFYSPLHCSGLLSSYSPLILLFVLF